MLSQLTSFGSTTYGTVTVLLRNKRVGFRKIRPKHRMASAGFSEVLLRDNVKKIDIHLSTFKDRLKTYFSSY